MKEIEAIPKDFNESVFYKINQLSIYIETLGKNFFEIRNVDVTLDEFKAIVAVLNYPGICQRDLAKIILRDRVRTGRILTSLEEKGYIKRSNDTKNNRLVRTLHITKAGKTLYEEQNRILMQVTEKLMEKFSKEQMDDLRGMLVKLETALSEVVEFQI